MRYNKKTKEERLIQTIDRYILNVDPYEYEACEIYPGYNKDYVTELVKNNCFSGIKAYLNEIIEEDRDEINVYTAKSLLRDILHFQKYRLRRER